MNGLTIGKSRVVVSLLGGRNPGNTRGQVTAAERVLHKAVAGPNGCAVYTGTQNGHGYGFIRDGSRKAMAHRVVYEALVGPIPEGLVIDHLCRNRACVNPAHMEPVGNGTNVLRGEGLSAENAAKTHCKRGHEFTPENTRNGVVRGKPVRICRTCHRDMARRIYWEKKGSAANV